MNLPPYPTANTPVNAAWGRQLIDYIRSVTPIGSATIMGSRTPAGTIARLDPVIPRAAPALTALPWQITLRGDLADFTYCRYRRGPVTKVLADISSATITGTTVSYVAAEINTATGSATILSSATETDVIDVEVPAPENSNRIRIELYMLVRPVSGSGEWSVRVPYLLMPDLTLYV
jgi:hypothetical protein